jgi:hypothetical protein
MGFLRLLVRIAKWPAQCDSSGELTIQRKLWLRVQLHVATTTAGRELADGDLAERFQVRPGLGSRLGLKSLTTFPVIPLSVLISNPNPTLRAGNG